MGIFDAVGDFFNDVGKALTGGGNNNSNTNTNSGTKSNTVSNTSNTSNTSNNTPRKTMPTPSTPSNPKHGSSSSSSDDNRSNSAGAQALTQQIDNNKSSGGSGSSTSSPSIYSDPNLKEMAVESTQKSSSSSSSGSGTKPSSSGSGLSAFQESIGNIVDSKAQETSSSQPTSGSTGNTRIDNFISTITQNVENAKSGSTNKSTTSTAEESSVDGGLSLGAGSILGSIIEDKPTQTVTEAIRGTSSSTSKKQSSVAEDVINGDGLSAFQESIGNIFNQKTTSSTTKSNEVTANDINLGVINTGALVGISPTVESAQYTDGSTLPKPTISAIQESPFIGVTSDAFPIIDAKKDDNMYIKSGLFFGNPLINTLMFGDNNWSNTEKPVVSTQSQSSKNDSVGLATEYLYRDVAPGIYTFDNKKEAMDFMAELYPEGNYDFQDYDVPWYSTKTGEYIGDLGQSAYPFAIVVPETSDMDVLTLWNTGGSKGGSPSTGTGLSSWTDVPSAKTRAALANEFDFSFSSKNLDVDEIKTQLERQGIDESWYDGLVGQNPIGYNAERDGGVDARTGTVTIADAKAGKVTPEDLSNVVGGQAILDVASQIQTQPTPEESAQAYMSSLASKTSPIPFVSFVTPNQNDITALYTVMDAVDSGMAKKDNKYWYSDSPILPVLFGGLGMIATGAGQLSSDIKENNMPWVNTAIEYAANPVGAFSKDIAGSITGYDYDNEYFTPTRATTWGLDLVKGTAESPQQIASLPENIMAAGEELGYDKLTSLAPSAALGLGNMIANDYIENPDYALFDVASLALPFAGFVSKASKLGKTNVNVDGVDVEFNKPQWDMSEAKTLADEINAKQAADNKAKKQFEKEVAKTEKQVGKEARRVAKTSSQYHPDISSFGNAGIGETISTGIRDLYDTTLKTKFANVGDIFSNIRSGTSKTERANDNAFMSSTINNDIDNIVKSTNVKNSGLSIFTDTDSNLPVLRDRDSSLSLLKDRSSNLPILRDRDSDLPILRDRDTDLTLFRNKDKDENTSLMIRDKDNDLVVYRDRDSNRYLPKDNDTPIVRKRDKDKILPFLDELGDLFGGSGTGGLSGGTYWGRGRGRSWKVVNEDIADASQFSGLF